MTDLYGPCLCYVLHVMSASLIERTGGICRLSVCPSKGHEKDGKGSERRGFEIFSVMFFMYHSLFLMMAC